MALAAHEIHHPLIGNVKGNSAGKVKQFLGIKYATLDHWFDNASLVQYDGSGLVADRHGPQAISDPSGINDEFRMIQKELPVDGSPGVSGTECLNLNLTVPSGAEDSPLPVLVFIHGGGFITGSNWWPQYDTKRIVQLSFDQGNPIIAININYRLGAPGFLTSEELRKKGLRSNHGHLDQQVALQWVKKYIPGFGGDPDQVTVIGESAGGISTTRLLYADEALASRIIVLGGSPPSISPMGPAAAEQAYRSVLKALDITELPLEGRIEALAKASPDALLEKLDKSLHFMPILDGETVPFVPTFKMASDRTLIPQSTSCKSLMVGYAPLDGNIFGFISLFQRKENIAASFTKSINTSLAGYPAIASQLLHAYEITEQSSDEDALMNILKFASDIGFRAPARALAEGFPGDSFLLEFAEPNPWDGPFKGCSTHILDVAFLFQNYNDHLDPRQKATAVAFASDVIGFVHGKAPWKKFQHQKGLSVYEDGSRTYKKDSGSRAGQYDCMVRLSEIVSMDVLLEAWGKFLFHS